MESIRSLDTLVDAPVDSLVRRAAGHRIALAAPPVARPADAVAAT